MADSRHRSVGTVTGTTAGTATGSSVGSGWLSLKGCNVDQRNFFDISLQAANDGTFSVSLQRKRPTEADSAARTIESYTTDTEKIGEIHGNWQIRLQVTDHTTTGDIVCELAQA